MAGRHLNARIRAQMVGGKIHLFRAAQAQKQYLHPGRPQPLRCCCRQVLGRGARIMAQDHPARAQFLGKGPRDGAHDVGGQLITQPPPYVIGLETLHPTSPVP